MTHVGKIIMAAASLLALTSLTGNAESRDCAGTVSGSGRSSSVEGSADWRKFGGTVPTNLARDRAIHAWKAAVSQRCPGHSTLWFRARLRDVACEGSAGHETCVAIGRPARKVFG